MKYLFRDGGLKIVESLFFTDTLFAFDFDGTLSEIVLDYGDARIKDTTLDLMKALSARVPLAIISGRSVNDLRQRVPFRPAFLVGNHGLERLGGKARNDSAAKTMCASWRKYVVAALKAEAFAGVELEDKEFSLALHYRKSRSKKDTKLGLLALAGSLEPSPRIILGKSVLNLVPVGAPHKGIALMEMMLSIGAKCGFYVGDDDTDEDVFNLPDARIVGVRVGKKKTSQAQYFIQRQSEINRLLKALVKFAERETL